MSPARDPQEKAATKGKGKKAAKDPNALKRPLSAYILYCNSRRDKVKAENPDASIPRV